MSQKIESALLEIADNTKDGVRAIYHLKKTIEEGKGTTNSFRIGALNRISEAVKYINSLEPGCTTDATAEYNIIRDILLGIGGE